MNQPAISFVSAPAPHLFAGFFPAWFLCLFIGSLPCFLAAADPKPVADVYSPIEGQWWGRLHYESAMTDLGMAFGRDADGRCQARIWFPIMSLYGEAVGAVASDGGKLVLKDAGFSFSLEAAGLVGTVGPYKFTLQRADRLPDAPPRLNLPGGPEPLWTYRAASPLWAPPVAVGDVIYVGDSAGKLHTVSLADGKARWIFDAGEPIFDAVLVADDGLYFLGDKGTLFRLDRSRGTVQWRVTLGGGEIKRNLPGPFDHPIGPKDLPYDYHGATLTLAENTLLIGAADGVVHAVDAASGRDLWTFVTGSMIRSNVLVAGNRAFVGCVDGTLHAFDRRTGQPLWKFATGGAVTSAPMSVGDLVVVGSRSAQLYALDADSGKVRWTVTFWGSWVESTAVLAQGTLYIGSSDSRRVRAIDPATGDMRWATDLYGWAWGNPAVSDGTIYLGAAAAREYFVANEGSLCALDRKTGALKWQRPMPKVEGQFVYGFPSSPAIAEGRLLVGGTDGVLYAFPVP